MGAKKTVMLTGASCHMGFHGFKELYAKKDKFNLVLLLRGSEKNRVKFKDFENDPSVRIVWGDLTNYEDVLNAVTGSDYILHVGGMVSPPTALWPAAALSPACASPCGAKELTALLTRWTIH